MNTRVIFKKFLSITTISLATVLLSTGCSDEKQPSVATGAQSTSIQNSNAKVSVHNPFDHSHDTPVTDVQKHKFEHDFADQCVQRELKNSTDKETDKKRYEAPCMCIARFLMKNLTADEAGMFLNEHKNAQSLVIKYENAAYHCLQQNSHPAGPDFSRSSSVE